MLKPTNVNVGTVTSRVLSPLPEILKSGGLELKGYTYILYEKIHTIDNSYNFGNIGNDTYRNVEVWNAFKDTVKTIDSISYNDLSGVNLLNTDLTEVEFPNSIKPLYSKIFTIEVKQDGDASNDGQIIIQFSDTYTASIDIALSRAILFDFDINTINGLVEEYEYNTGIITSLDSSEQRFAKIETPRAIFNYFYSLTDKDRRTFDAYLYSGNTNLSLPLYSQKCYVDSILNNIIYTDITNTCIQAGIDILVKDEQTKEIIKVKSIINNNQIELNGQLLNEYVNAVIYPLVSVKMQPQNSKTIKHKNFTEYSIVFEKVIDNINTLHTNSTENFNTYNNLYLLEEQNGGPLTVNYNKRFFEFDNGYSKKSYTIVNNIAQVEIPFSNYTTSKNELSKVKNLFKNQKGAFEDIYSKSFENNIKVVENVAAGDIIVIVENNNLTNFYKDKRIKQVYFKYLDGQEKIFEITDIYKVDDDKEAIMITNGFGVDVAVNDFISADFVYKGRLSDDILKIEMMNFKVARYDLMFIKNNDIE